MEEFVLDDLPIKQFQFYASEFGISLSDLVKWSRIIQEHHGEYKLGGTFVDFLNEVKEETIPELVKLLEVYSCGIAYGIQYVKNTSIQK